MQRLWISPHRHNIVTVQTEREGLSPITYRRQAGELIKCSTV